jgi:hypothetical protein
MRELVVTALVILGLLGLLLGGAWLAMIRMPGASHAGPLAPLTPEQEQMRQRLEADVRHLAVEIGERNVWRAEGLRAAAEHIERTFRSLGYAVESQAYRSHGEVVRNVEATLRGTARAGEIVLVGGHYDSVLGTVGANDNGTGVAAVLELARALAGRPQPRTLRFVAFVNEEPPHFNVDEMGSQFYAREAALRGDRITAMLSLETLGCYSDEPGSQQYPFPFSLFYPDRGDFVAFVGNLDSRALVHRAIGAFRAAAAFPSQGVAAPEFVPGVSWSDHGSFWPFGYPAIMITDTALYRYPHYHTPDDLPEHVDFARLARVVAGIRGVVEALAAGPGIINGAGDD